MNELENDIKRQQKLHLAETGIRRTGTRVGSLERIKLRNDVDFLGIPGLTGVDRLQERRWLYWMAITVVNERLWGITQDSLPAVSVSP